MYIAKYSMIIKDCDYDIAQLMTGIRNKNNWIDKNMSEFKFRRGERPKEIIISTENPNNFGELADSIDRLVHNKERK